MDPRALLTPAMRSVLERMARAGHPPMHTLPASLARAAYEAGSGVLDLSAPPMARVEDFSIPVSQGMAIPARLVAPSHERLPVLVYFHGGGFTIGSIATHDTLCRLLAAQAQCAVVSVGYRLAPEHVFPVAVLDSASALFHVHKFAIDLGVDGSRMAVGGDSAGGTLAAVCAILARDAGLKLALQLLFYPGTCAHQQTASHQSFAKGFVLEKAHIDYFFNQYIPVDQRDDWRFAPLNAPDVESVAPAWIGLAECDPLVDEGVLYGDKLRTAGVPVDLEIYRGVVHEFIKMGRAISEALQAHTDATRALRAAFTPQTEP